MLFRYHTCFEVTKWLLTARPVINWENEGAGPGAGAVEARRRATGRHRVKGSKGQRVKGSGDDESPGNE